MARDLISGDNKIKALKPGAKRLSDGKGLYLLPFVNGGSHGWRFDYTFEASRKTLSLGTYPEIGLSKAREIAAQFRTMVATGIDPSAERKAARRREKEAAEFKKRQSAGEAVYAPGSFADAALQWHQYRSKRWASDNAESTLVRMKKHLFPTIGSKMLDQVTQADMCDVLDRIEDSGSLDTAHRVRWICEKVYTRAGGRGLVTKGFNPAKGIELNAPISKRYPAVTDPTALGPLLNAMDAYAGSAVVCAALRLLPIFAVRPGTLRYATWDEFDLDAGWWRIPAWRLKKSQERKLNGPPHWIPLPLQAVQILQELRALTGRGKFVFPSQRTLGKPMSENAINLALRNLGFPKDVVTGHGFRSTARTILDEVLNVDSNLLEVQLGHAVPGPHADTYARVEYREFRSFVMQMWADYLDALREGPTRAEVIVMKHRQTFGPARILFDDWRAVGEKGMREQGLPLQNGPYVRVDSALAGLPMRFGPA